MEPAPRLSRHRGKAGALVALGNTQMKVYHELLSHPGVRYTDLGRGHSDGHCTGETAANPLGELHHGDDRRQTPPLHGRDIRRYGGDRRSGQAVTVAPERALCATRSTGASARLYLRCGGWS